jgi:hypothetical protein
MTQQRRPHGATGVGYFREEEFVRAFSSEVDTGSRQENASK